MKLCIGDAWVNSPSYVDDMVLLASMATASQTLLDKCSAYAGPHNIIYRTTQRKQHVCWSDRSNKRAGTQQQSD